MTKYQLIELALDSFLTGGIIFFCILLVKFRRSVDNMAASNKAMIAAIEDHKLAIREFLVYAKPLFAKFENDEPPTRPN